MVSLYLDLQSFTNFFLLLSSKKKKKFISKKHKELNKRRIIWELRIYEQSKCCKIKKKKDFTLDKSDYPSHSTLDFLPPPSLSFNVQSHPKHTSHSSALETSSLHVLILKSTRILDFWIGKEEDRSTPLPLLTNQPFLNPPKVNKY